MCSRPVIVVAFLCSWLMAFTTRCAFLDNVDTYGDEGSNLARGKFFYPAEDTNHLGVSLEESHDQMRPSKRPRGEEDQVLVNGPLRSLREKHEKMHQDYSELIAEMQAVETYLNLPVLKDSVASETYLYNSLKLHLRGWTIGKTNELIVPHDIRIATLARHLKVTLHDMRALEPKSLPILRERSARDLSLAKLKLKLWMERIIIWAIHYLYDFQKIGYEQLLDLLCDQRSLNQIGYHIHDVYQISNPQKFWPSTRFFTQDPALEHLHMLLRALPRATQMALVHTVLSKICQSFQHYDRLRLNLIHPKFHEVIDKTGGEFLMAISKQVPRRTSSETETIFQGLQQVKDFSSRVDGPVSSNSDSPVDKSRSDTKDDGITPYKAGIENTESLLHFYMQYSIAQLGARDEGEQLRIETTYRHKILAKKPLADEMAAKLLFDPIHGTCQARVPEWKLSVEHSASGTPGAQPNQPIDLTCETRSPNPTRERLRFWTLNIY